MFHLTRALARRARKGAPRAAMAAVLPAVLLTAAACADSPGASTPTDLTAVGSHGPKTRVDTIYVTPTSVSVQVGAATTLSATAYSGGKPLSIAISWSSGNSGIATVTADGSVTGIAAGSTTVTAAVGGKRTTVSVAVTAPPSSGTTSPGSGTPVVAECASPRAGWIFCDDFEQDRTASYFETDNASGSFVRTAGVGVGGSMAMRAHFAQGQVNAGSLHLAFGRTPTSYIRPVDAGTANYRDIYWRVYLRNEAGWVGGGGDKLSRAQSLASSNWGQAMAAQIWSGGQSTNWNQLLIDPASGTDSAGTLQTTSYNDFNHLRWLGAASSTTPLFDAAHVGQWYCVEAHARLNDAGQSNGVFELWINGIAEASRTGLNWVGSFPDYGINAVYLENYWNAGAPQAQARELDNFVVSTQRIGC